MFLKSTLIKDLKKYLQGLKKYLYKRSKKYLNEMPKEEP